MPLPAITPDQLRNALQELQLQQIELELQYEELMVTQAETENLRVRYTDLFEFAPVGYVVFDVLGVIQEVNQRATQLVGSSRPRLKRRRFLLFVMPECREEFLRFTVEVMSAEGKSRSIDLLMCREDGTPFHAHLEGLALPSPWGSRQCRLAVTDTSAQFQTPAELKNTVAPPDEGESRFHRLFAHSDDAMVLLRNSYVLACNDATLRLFGITDENNLIGRHLAAGAPATQPDGRPSRAVAEEGLLWAMRLNRAEFEWIQQRADTREPMWHQVRLTRLSGDDDALVHAVFRDITPLMRQEGELYAQEEILQLSLAAAKQGLWTWDPTTDTLTLDARTRQALQGHSEVIPDEDGTLAPLLRILHPDDRARAEIELRQCCTSPGTVDFEWRVIWPDGSVHRVVSRAQVQPEMSGAPMRLNAVMAVAPNPAA